MRKQKHMIAILKKLREPVMNGIVMAVIASILTTIIIDKTTINATEEQRFKDISNIYIGCNKEWMDDRFGVAQFSAYKDDFLLCAYISDAYVIQVAYDNSNSAYAYLITVLNDKSSKKVKIKDETWLDGQEIILGSTTYYDLPLYPMFVEGAISNGNARAIYAEVYSYIGTGNYYFYCYATLDFGKLKGSLDDLYSEFGMPTGDIDDEVSKDRNKGIQVITNRKYSCPNSYGVAVSSDAFDFYALDLLLSYDWFNSLQLRNRYN